MSTSTIDFETDHLNYIKTIIAPDKYASLIPDGVIDKVVVKSDTSSYMITSEGGEGSFTIEFYPLTETEVVGAIFAYSTVAQKDVWVANITRASDLKLDYNWIRNAAKKLTAIMDTRTLENDTLAGKVSGIESQVGISEIGSQFSYTSLLGIVNNVESKKTTSITEGLVILAIPKAFDLPYTRLRDDIVNTVPTSPSGAPVGATNAVYVDEEHSLRAQLAYIDTVTVTTTANTQVSERVFNIDSTTGTQIALFSRFTPQASSGNALKHQVIFTSYDLAGDQIRTGTVFARRMEVLTANESNDVTLVANLAPDPDKDSQFNRPIHSIKVVQQIWQTGGAPIQATLITNINIDLPNGAKIGTNRPVVLLKGQGLPEGSVLDIQLSTVDEVIPNGSLQRNSTLLHPLFSPASRRVVEVFAAHGNEMGLRPILTTTEYEELLSRIEGLSLTEEDMTRIMNASTPKWLRKVGKFLKGTEGVYKAVKPLLELSPAAPYLPLANATYDTLRPMKTASNRRAFQKSYYASDTPVETLQADETTTHNTTNETLDVREYTRKPGDSCISVLAVDYERSSREFLKGRFAALRGDHRNLLGEAQKNVFTGSLGKGRVYGYLSPSVFPFRLREDVTLIPLEDSIDSLQKNKLKFVYDGPICSGESAWAAILIVQNTGMWCTNIAVSASVRVFKKEMYLRPVANIKEKKELADRLGIKILTTKSNESGVVNRNYLRQAVSYIRNHMGEESPLPDEPTPEDALTYRVLAASHVQINSQFSNTRVYQCASKKRVLKKMTLAPVEEPDPEEGDAEANFSAKYDELSQQLSQLISILKDPEFVGETRAKAWEYIEGSLAYIEDKMMTTQEENPDALKEVGESVVRAVARMPEGATVVTTTGAGVTPGEGNLALKRLDYLNKVAPESYPEAKKLTDWTKNRVPQFSYLYLNAPASKWPYFDKVTNIDAQLAQKHLEYEDPETAENLFTYDYNQLAKLALGNSIPPDKFGDLMEHFGVGKIKDLTKEDNKFLAALAGKSKVVPLRIHEMSEQEVDKEMRRRMVDPKHKEEVLKRSRNKQNNWEAGLTMSPEEIKPTEKAKVSVPKKMTEAELRAVVKAQIKPEQGGRGGTQGGKVERKYYN